MEISNRILIVACISIVAIAVAVRTHSTPIANADANPPYQATQLKPIPTSDFGVLQMYGTLGQSPTSGGTPNANLIKQNQSQVVTPKVSGQNSQQASGGQVGDSGMDDQSVSDDQDFDDQDDSAGGSSNLTLDPSGKVSDHEMLDVFVGTMDDSDRAGFRTMWATMSSAQRQDFTSKLH